VSRIWGRGLVSVAMLGVLTVAAWAGIPPLSFAPTVDVELGPSGCTTGVDCSEGAVAVVAGDFNDDGKLDIATANNGSDDATVLLGDGQGGLTVEATLPAGVAPSAIASGNLDANTVIDLVVANETDSTISVYLGNGDGTFDAPTTYAMGLSPESVVLADFDGDTMLDVATADLFGESVSVRLGNGDGTFGDIVTTAVSGGPLGMAVGRLNNDANEDLVVSRLRNRYFLDRERLAKLVNDSGLHGSSHRCSPVGADRKLDRLCIRSWDCVCGPERAPLVDCNGGSGSER